MKIRMGLALLMVLLWGGLGTAPEACAAASARHAMLILSAKQAVNTGDEAFALVQKNKAHIINSMTDHIQTFAIQLPKKGQPDIETSDMDFLFGKAVSAGKKERRAIRRIAFPGDEGGIFIVEVPVVEKGSEYWEEKGKIIVRVDKVITSRGSGASKKKVSVNQVAEFIHQPATMIKLFVDEQGNIYW